MSEPDQTTGIEEVAIEDVETATCAAEAANTTGTEDAKETGHFEEAVVNEEDAKETEHFEEAVINAIMLLRLFEGAGVVLIAVSLPALARSVGKDPARAVWLGVCNPLVLFHFVAGGHNDALMIGLIVAGLAVATTGARRPLLGVLLCMVAATIKAPAVIPAAFIIVDAVGV